MTKISVDKIIMDSTCQARQMNGPTVYLYSEAMQDGAQFPPIIVFVNDQGEYWLADGFHRVTAAKEAGISMLEADVRTGGQREAMFYALGPANQTHGLPLNRQERRERVVKLLHDAEWVKMSDREIARHTGVSHPTVASIRKETGNFTSERKTADGRTMNTAAINENRHWGLSNGMAFWSLVERFGLDKHTILEQIQPNATNLTDLTMSKEDCWRRLDEMAIQQIAARFPVGSYVKHPTGRFGRIETIYPTHIHVMDSRIGYYNSWDLKGIEPATQEEYEAAVEQEKAAKAANAQLPIRQIEFLQALLDGQPVDKNAATRMALRQYGFITPHDDWDAIEITVAGARWMKEYAEAVEAEPEKTIAQPVADNDDIERSLGGRGATVQLPNGTATLVKVCGRIAYVDTINGQKQYRVEYLSPISADQPAAAQELPAPTPVVVPIYDYEQEALDRLSDLYESEDIVELLPSLVKLLEFAEGHLEATPDLFECVRQVVVWADGIEQINKEELAQQAQIKPG